MSKLKKDAVTAVRWTTVSMITTTVISFLRLAILARLLMPKDFGLMAMVMVVIGFAQIWGKAGINEAIIQRQESTRNQLSSLYWLNVFVGVAVFFIVLIGTPFISWLLNTKELKELLPYVALTFLILPWGQQFQALLQKNLKFKELAFVEIISITINAIIAIFFAWSGFGVWSLVWGQLSGVTFRTISLLVIGRINFKWPAMHFRFKDLNGYLSFGLHRVGAMSINFFNSRVDQLLIGALLGSESLGYYSLAFRLVLEPIQKLNPILTRVAFPVFSKVQNDISRLRKGFFKMLKTVMMIDAPLLIGVAVTSPVAVPLFLGEKWNAAIPVIQILAIYAIIRSIANTGGSIVLARGRADLTFYYNLALLFIIPFVVYISALSGNLVVVAWSVLFVYICLFICHYKFIISKVIGSCFFNYISSLGVPILLAASMGMIVYCFGLLIDDYSFFVQLVVQIIAGIILYFMFLIFFQRDHLYEMINFMFERS